MRVETVMGDKDIQKVRTTMEIKHPRGYVFQWVAGTEAIRVMYDGKEQGFLKLGHHECDDPKCNRVEPTLPDVVFAIGSFLQEKGLCPDCASAHASGPCAMN